MKTRNMLLIKWFGFRPSSFIQLLVSSPPIGKQLVALLILSIMIQFSSCSRNDDGDKMPITKDVQLQELAQLKNAVEPYADFETAKAAGYDVDATGYRKQMGHHFVNGALVDDFFELEKPEILIFAPDAMGTMQLVGVEYIVPIADIDNPQPAPEGFTGDEDVWEVNTEFNVWMLHAWIIKENPNGIFTAMNPSIPDEAPYEQELAQLKMATEAYVDFEVAKADGYDVDATGYRKQMGHHFVKGALVDDVFELEKPELLIYAPDDNGVMQLVGVEYIVPILDMDNPQPPPEGFTGDMDIWEVNTEFNVWMLHAWIIEENPNGVFMAMNPNIPDHAPYVRQLAKLTEATAPYADFGMALEAGYDVDATGFRMQMGHHFVNGALVDDVFELEKPEILIFAPDDNGVMQFVGVEYIVPILDMDNPQPPPEGFIGDMDVWEVNTEFNVWMLHAWVGEENPDGVFTGMNPNIPEEAEYQKELARLKTAVGNFLDFEEAMACGYNVDATGYRANMGHHYVYGALVDDVFEIEKPELLLYVPDDNDVMQLVGVEYIVPITDINNPPPPPAGFTGDADVWKVDTEFNVWALHAWVIKDNPAGIFTPLNPRVPVEAP